MKGGDAIMTCTIAALVVALQYLTAPTPQSVTLECDPCSCGGAISECYTYRAHKAKIKEDRIDKIFELMEVCTTDPLAPLDQDDRDDHDGVE